MTFGDIETIYVNQLPAFYDKEEAKNIAALAVQDVCKVSRSYYLLHKSQRITLNEETLLIRILDELRFGRPLQYVLEEADFMGLRFKVDSSVLIPRPETEELVHWIISELKDQPTNALRVLDIGTGTGCIPVSLKKNMPSLAVWGLDISGQALQIAEKNALANDAEVSFIEADIRNEQLELDGRPFEVIVSNPPYITESEKKAMRSNVLEHEPHLALFVPDEDPLLFYKCILNFSRKHLAPGGRLYLEINEAFGKEVCQLLTDTGFSTELRKDLHGKDRMVRASLN